MSEEEVSCPLIGERARQGLGRVGILLRERRERHSAEAAETSIKGRRAKRAGRARHEGREGDWAGGLGNGRGGGAEQQLYNQQNVWR